MKSVWALLILLSVFALAAGYSVREAMPPSLGATSKVNVARSLDVVRGIAFVEPRTEIHRLHFETDGVIDRCAVEVGQVVRCGEMLMSLRNALQQADVAVAEQETALALAELEQVVAGVNQHRITAAQRKVELLNAQFREARRHYGRIHKLLRGGTTTVAEDDRAETEVSRLTAETKMAEADLDSLRHFVRPTDRAVAEARLALARARLESAKHALELTTLRAPFDGTVLELLKREGERAALSNAGGVIVFADSSQLRLRAEIDERHVHRLAAGQTVTVTGRGIGEQRLKGRLAQVKQIMGKKTVFTREASERKDLDVIQCWVDMPADFRAPLGLQVDVDVDVSSAHKRPKGLAASGSRANGGGKHEPL